MNTIWQDALYELSHGDAVARTWDALAGGTMLLLGLWLGFEMCRPGEDRSRRDRTARAEPVPVPVRQPAPESRLGRRTLRRARSAARNESLAGKGPAELAALAESARQDRDRLETVARAAGERAVAAWDWVGFLEKEIRRLDAERTQASGALRDGERQLQAAEAKVQSARDAVAQAAEEVLKSPSALAALWEGEALETDKEAARAVSQAIDARRSAQERLGVAEAGLARLEREIAEARLAAAAADRKAAEAAEAAVRARTVCQVVEKAARKRRGRRNDPLAAGTDGGRPAPGSGPLRPMSTAALAAAKLRARDHLPLN